MAAKALFAVAFVLCGVLARGAVLTDDIVTISSGQILGIRDATNNIRYWRGVPFGADTGGANRFLPPQPPAPWSDVLNCTTYGPGCISTHHNADTAAVQSEDCLNLNIYVPLSASLRALESNTALPVMIWIYGGGFAEGDNEGPFNMYDGRYMAATQDVIIVNINYRLGAFGYAVTDKLDGNWGVMDQRLAMQWVQTNIGVFGGDKNMVTLWGESAGAMSVGIHLISPPSRGLFHRGIMESNPVGMLYKKNDHARDYGMDFCYILGCAGPLGLSCDSDCMRAVPSANVTKAWDKSASNVLVYIEANWGHIDDGFLDYMPTIDGVQVPSQILPALANGDYDTSVPVLLGSNTNEGATFVYAGVNDPLPMFLYDLAMDGVFGDNADAIRKYYEPQGFTDGRAALSAVFTDYWFRCAAEKFATAAVSRNVNAWVYRYTHVISVGAVFKEFGLPAICATEVCHASELPLVFHRTRVNTPKGNFSLTPAEGTMADGIETFFANFAKTGNPNTPNTPPFQWPLWDATKRINLDLNLTLGTEDSVALCSAWDKWGYDY